VGEDYAYYYKAIATFERRESALNGSAVCSSAIANLAIAIHSITENRALQARFEVVITSSRLMMKGDRV
jgi:hypothetical protein